jgi:hypothetical protein
MLGLPIFIRVWWIEVVFWVRVWVRVVWGWEGDCMGIFFEFFGVIIFWYVFLSVGLNRGKE